MRFTLLSAPFRYFPRFSVRSFSIANQTTDKQVMENEVNFSIQNNSLGLIELNRPKQLNALTHSMIKNMLDKISEWNNSMNVIAVIGAGDKAFCAGGDVMAVVRLAREGAPSTCDFFRDEYKLDYLTSTLSVPYVSLIDGITMGGGCGISMHGKYRVATERTLFAMPETAIGLIPDVGGSYFLSRMPNSVGSFLALTGHRLKGYDLVHAGLATHFCRSDQLPALIHALSQPEQTVEHVLSVCCPHTADMKHVTEYSLAPHIDLISRCFHQPTVDDIMKALRAESSDFADQALERLYRMSPMSLVLTHRLLNSARALDLRRCLQAEFRVVYNILTSRSDFSEGIRCVLEDKGDTPRWLYTNVTDVPQFLIDRFFSRLDDKNELILV